MWIICQADDSHEMPRPIFFLKNKNKFRMSSAKYFGTLWLKRRETDTFMSEWLPLEINSFTTTVLSENYKILVVC